MSEALPVPEGSPRCPSCLALTPVDAHGRLPAFCSLCHAPLQAPRQAPLQASSELSPHVAQPVERAHEPTAADTGPTTLDEQAVARMLIELQASDPDPWVARGSRVSTRTGKVLLGLGAAAAVLVVVLAVAAVFGLLVAGR